MACPSSLAGRGTEESTTKRIADTPRQYRSHILRKRGCPLRRVNLCNTSPIRHSPDVPHLDGNISALYFSHVESHSRDHLIAKLTDRKQIDEGCLSCGLKAQHTDFQVFLEKQCIDPGEERRHNRNVGGCHASSMGSRCVDWHDAAPIWQCVSPSKNWWRRAETHTQTRIHIFWIRRGSKTSCGARSNNYIRTVHGQYGTKAVPHTECYPALRGPSSFNRLCMVF